MRVATEEEDILLQKISKLQGNIYNLENEVMLCESQDKGYRERKRQLTVKFFSVIILCAFLLILSSGYLVRMNINWRLTLAIYLASGGLGFFALGFLVYTIIVVFRHLAATGSTDFWITMAEKIGVDNLYSLSLTNTTKMNQNKRIIRKDNDELEEALKEYLVLKDKNDKQFEADVASGKIKAGMNFDPYNSFVDVTNDLITFNKLRVEQLKLSNKRRNLEKDVEDMIQYESDCKKSIIWFLVLFFILIGTVIALIICAFFESNSGILYWIRFSVGLFLMISGFVVIISFINFLFKFPFLSKSQLALFLADKFGFEKTKKDRDDMMNEIEGLNKRLEEVKEELETTKKILAEKKEESVYR